MIHGKGTAAWFMFTVAFSLWASASLWSQQGPTIAPPSTVPLIQALREGDLDEAHRLLRSGAKPNVIDNYGDTPLLQAIRGGYTDFAEELLSSGADPKFPDGNGTALIVAAWYRDLRIAKILVGRGVSVNAANSKGETALMSASQTCPDGKMVQFLLDMGANPNAKSDSEYTALMSAASAGNVIAAEKLLKAGGDPRVKNKRGETAEDEACSRSDKDHIQVCTLLRDVVTKNVN